MTNEELVTSIQSGVNVNENMALLYDQLKRFIHKLARAYQGYAEIDDLMQEGYLALQRAVEHYDPEKSQGAKFITYAAYWIRQGMSRYMANCCRPVRLPVYVYAQIRQYKHMVNEYTLNHGAPPSDDQIAYYMHITLDQLAQLKKDMLMTGIASLDKPVGEDEERAMGDFVPDDADIEAATLDQVEQGQIRKILWLAVDSLPNDQGKIIRGRYQGGKTLEELGKQLGKSRECVRQGECEALRKLRRPLRPFAEEFIQSHAYHHTGYEFSNRTWTSATEWTALKLLERT